MSTEQLVTFNDLINSTFNNGSLNLKNLQILFKILVTQLKLEDVKANFSEEISWNIKVVQESDTVFNVKKGEKTDEKTDLVIPTIPKLDEIADILCKSKLTNPIVDMLDLLNVTKRVEAVEISVQKLASMMETLLKKKSFEEQPKSEVEKEEKNEIISIDGVRETESKISDAHSLTSKTSKGKTSSIDQQHSRLSESLKKSSRSVQSINKEQTSNQASKTSFNNVQETPTRSTHEMSTDELKRLVDESIIEASALVTEQISKLMKSVCDLQKTVASHQETIDDLMFACESNDMKNEETANDFKDFNSKIFCLKSDVKSLLANADEVKMQIIGINNKCEVINNVKTNKSYVDELCGQKAFKSDLEFLVSREEFDPLMDVLRLKFSLLTDHFENLETSTKKSLACLKSVIDEKLEKQELETFKDATTKLFDEFVREIVILLHKLTKNPLGLAATKKLDPNLNCLACETKLSMKNEAPNVPKLSAISQRFKHEMQKIPVESEASNENFRQVFCMETKAQKPRVSNCSKKSMLNFPQSQPCFVVAEDNTIYKADTVKLLIKSRNSK